MEFNDVFAEILRQGIEAKGPRHAVKGSDFSSAAEELGDEFYRLTIEFGIVWNDFKRAALDEVLNLSPAASASEAAQPGAKPRFVLPAGHEAQGPLVLLALEVMPYDSEL